MTNRLFLTSNRDRQSTTIKPDRLFPQYQTAISPHQP